MIEHNITPEMLKNFSVIKDGRVLLHIGLQITLYIEDAHLPGKREGLIQCFDDYWALCGDRLLWASEPLHYKRWLDLRKEKLAPLREWVPKLDHDKPWSVTCIGEKKMTDASIFNIEIACAGAWQNRLSYITATLPFVWFSDHEGSLPQLVQRWCEWTSPYHGYAGLGIISPLDGAASAKAEPKVYALAQRFPGLEVDYPISQRRYLKEGIKGVNWLTVLGDKWVEGLGGRDRLREQLESDFVFYDYMGGLIIQAGPHPQFGDANRKNIPKQYRTLSRLLKPIRVDYPVALQHTHPNQDSMDRERTSEWFARFD